MEGRPVLMVGIGCCQHEDVCTLLAMGDGRRSSIDIVVITDLTNPSKESEQSVLSIDLSNFFDRPYQHFP